MELPDVKERKELYFEHAEKCKDQIRRCATVHKNLVVLDLRNEEIIFAGNRFIVYALFPQTNISIHVLWGLKNQNTVFATGKSILNRTSKTNIGALMLEYGGGGHENAGTCQVNEMAEDVLGALIHRITTKVKKTPRGRATILSVASARGVLFGAAELELFFRQSDLVVGAELVVLEHVLRRQHLVFAVRLLERGVLEAVGVVAAGPAVEVAHVGAQAGLVHHHHGLRSGWAATSRL
jgi:hypothetical protein